MNFWIVMISGLETYHLELQSKAILFHPFPSQASLAGKWNMAEVYIVHRTLVLCNSSCKGRMFRNSTTSHEDKRLLACRKSLAVMELGVYFKVLRT